jgi:DNA-binding Xre family transcriptional regulator
LQFTKIIKNHKNRELQKALGLSLAEIIELAEKSLHTEVYTLDEVCRLLETTKEEIILNSLSQNTSECKFIS